MTLRETPLLPKPLPNRTSNSWMNPVRRVRNLKSQAPPVKAAISRRAPAAASLHRPAPLRSKTATNIIKPSPPNKIPASQKLSAACTPPQLPCLPTQTAKSVPRLIPRRHRQIRPRLAISNPTLISRPPPVSRKTHLPMSAPLRHPKLILHHERPPPPSIHRKQPQPQPYRPLQLLSPIPFHPSWSFPASAPFEPQPTPRAPRVLTFRSAA